MHSSARHSSSRSLRHWREARKVRDRYISRGIQKRSTNVDHDDSANSKVIRLLFSNFFPLQVRPSNRNELISSKSEQRQSEQQLFFSYFQFYFGL